MVHGMVVQAVYERAMAMVGADTDGGSLHAAAGFGGDRRG